MKLWILYFLPIYLFYDEFRVGAWDMSFSQLKPKGPSLEKIVGTNGKVGPNPRLIMVSIEYTYKRWVERTI
jgi:hypothetical protein